MENHDMPLVSAVITTYKRDVETVRRALNSIVNQDYPNIEVFVVNDFPSNAKLVEEIEFLVNEYSNKRTMYYIVVKKNGGACKARNLALDRANGKYIAFLDDDDEWMTDKITLQVDRILNASDIGLVYCNSLIRYVELKKEKTRFSDKQPEGEVFSDLLGENIIGSCSFPLFSVSELRKIGGFNETMPALQDWELYLRLVKKCKVGYIEKPVAIYNFYKGERISTHPEHRVTAYEKIHNEFLRELSLNNNKKSASQFYLMGTYFYSVSGDVVTAFKYYVKGMILEPLKISRNVKSLIRLLGRPIIRNRYV